MALVLYNHDLLADAYKVRLLLSLLGLPYESRTVAMLPGAGADAPAFRALSPAGTVPVLIDGDIELTRPEAILIHLAERHDPAGRFLPGDGADRAAVLDWLFFTAGDLRAAEAARLKSLFGAASAFADPYVTARTAFRVLEGHLVRQTLRGERFFVGDQATLADLAMFPAVALAADFGLGMEEFPRLLTWSRRLHALPGFITMSGVREMV